MRAQNANMPSRKAPEPDYVVLCSEAVDWQGDAEMVAAAGFPMLVHGVTRRDLEFVRGLAKKHQLKSSMNLAKKQYLLWKTGSTASDSVSSMGAK